MNHSISIGIDSHASTNSICAFVHDTGELIEETLGSDPALLSEWVRAQGFEGRVLCCYEAGPTGFELARSLRRDGIACIVAATSKLPKRIDRKKTDRIDAEWLARMLAAGSMRSVYVPTETQEALRHLSHLRADIAKQIRASKQKVASFMLLTKTSYLGTKRRWSKRFRQWAASYEFPVEEDTFVFRSKMRQLAFLEAELAEIEDRIRSCIEADESLSKLVNAFCAIHGIGFVTAFSLAAEICDFSRFKKGSELACYLGLVPSENSSGKRTARGPIVKSGNSNLRTLLIEAANAYSKPRKSPSFSCDKTGGEALSKAEACTQRLYRKRRHLVERGLEPNKVKVAIARELAEWIYWIAMEVG